MGVGGTVICACSVCQSYQFASAPAVASAPAAAFSHVHTAAPAKPGVLASSPSAAATPAPAPAHVDGKRPSVVCVGGFGLDVAVAQKITSKHDYDSESKMIAWISAVTNYHPAPTRLSESG